jgi:hypothetical protein
MLPPGWRRCDSSAVAGYRFDAEKEVLAVAYVDGDTAYEYRCSFETFSEFLVAPSKGRFVNGLLKRSGVLREYRL